MFLGILECFYNSEGILAHYRFSTMACWTGMHILHASVAIIASAVFLIISIIVSLTFFETKTSSNSANARINARSETLLLSFKVIMIFLTTLFTDPSFQWLIAIILLIGGGLIFFRIRSERPFYNDIVNKYVDVLNGVYFWGSFILILAMITQYTNFNSSVILLFIGIPLIALLIALLPDNRRSLLMKNLTHVENGEIWQLKIKYYFLLIKEREINRNASIILNGFINEHEASCENLECPLKIYLQNTQSKEKEKEKVRNKSINSDINSILISFAGKLYQEGLSKFKDCTALRISYAFYLLEKMNNKNMAVAEFVTAEKYSPPFDEQFIIYRYKKMIEDEYSDIQGDNNQDLGGNLDVVSLLAFDNHYRQCRLAIERAAALHMEFWNSLIEDHPDLSKLSRNGSRINTTIMAVEEHWSKMQKLNPNTTKGLKLYSDFLISVLNDEEGGRELMSRARDNTYTKVTVTDANNTTNPMNFAPDGTACVIAGSEKGKIGEILNLNMGVCRIFGFSKAELVGKNVEILMPELYAQSHSKVLTNCMSKGTEDSNKGNERFILATHKSQYLLPLVLTTRIHLSVNQGIQFVALFKTEKKSISVCYLLLDKMKNIVGISSRCISYLKLNNKIVKYCKVNAGMISDQFLLEENNQFLLSKNGAIVEAYQIETINEVEKLTAQRTDISNITYITNITSNSQSSNIISKDLKIQANDEEKKLKVKASRNTIKCNCNMSEINILDSGIAGYIIRLEPLFENKASYHSEGDRQPHSTNFQFLFDPFEGRYIREIDDADKEKKLQQSFYKARMEANSISNLTNSQLSASKIKKEKEDNNKEETKQNNIDEKDDEHSKHEETNENEKDPIKRINYAEGISTFRWASGGEFNPIDIETNMLEVRKKEGDQLINTDELKHKDEENKNINSQKNNVKLKKKALNNAITEKTVPSSILQLKRSGYIMGLSLIILISVEFGIIQGQFPQLIDNFNMINFSYRQLIIQMRIAYEIYKYCIYKKSNEPYFHKDATIDDATYLAERQKFISDYLAEFYNVQSSMSLSQLSMSNDHSFLYNDNTAVSLYFQGTSGNSPQIMKYTLTEALLLMASSVFTVNNNLANDYDPTSNQNVWFVLYNSFTELTEIMKKNSNYFVLDLFDRTYSQYRSILIMFIMSIVIFVISILVLFPVVASVTKSKFDVLRLFLDIPLGNVRQLQRKCENFITSYQEENKDENASNAEVFSEDKSLAAEDVLTAEKGIIGRGRFFKNQQSTNIPFFIKYLVGILIFEAYFVVNFVFNVIYLNDVNNYNKELNVTSLAHSNQSFSMSVFEGFVAYGSLLSKDKLTTFNLLAQSYIKNLYEIATSIQNIHNDNEGSTLTNDYLSIFDDVMRDDLCDYSTEFKFTFVCSKFIDGSMTEGLHPVMIYFIETLRDLLREYQDIQNDPNLPTDSDKNSSISTNILNSKKYKNIEIIVTQVSEQSFTFLRTSLINSLKSKDASQSTRRVISFVVILILILLVFVSIWTPFINNLNKEVLLIRYGELNVCLHLFPLILSRRLKVFRNISIIKAYFLPN